MNDLPTEAEEISTAPGGISGKRFAIAFAGLLLVSLIFGIPTVLRFEAIQDNLESARQTWPAAASSLEEYYAMVESKLAKDPDSLEKFQALHTQFLASPTFEKQVPPMLELEKNLNSHTFFNTQQDEGLVGKREEVMKSSGMRKYLEAEAKLRQSETDTWGQVTRTFFRLPLSPTTGF